MAIKDNLTEKELEFLIFFASFVQTNMALITSPFDSCVGNYAVKVNFRPEQKKFLEEIILKSIGLNGND